METVKKREKAYIGILLLCIFMGSLFLLSFISYSDGDDTFFQIYTSEMGFLEYVAWRYKTWSGRVIAEALLYAFFNMNIWAWRIVNASMITALPLLLTILQKRVVDGKDVDYAFTAAITVFFLLDINAFGYAGIWMTGSMNYLWPDVCGMIVLLMVVNFLEEKSVTWFFFPACICAMIAAMSSEQMGAVLLAFEVLCTAKLLFDKKKVPIMLPVLFCVTIAAFAVSATAPGNALRVADSIEYYLPQFELLSLKEKGFLLLQWLVSSFANENAVLLAAIWIGIFFALLQEKKCKKKILWMSVSVIGTVAVLLSKLGVTVISDLGIDLSEMTGCIEQVPTAAMMTGVQWGVLAFWGIAIIMTFFQLWAVTNRNEIVLFTYLGAIACEAVMIFSPTIYSSGARVFFLTGLMLMFIVLVLLEQLKKQNLGIPYVCTLVVIGVANFVLQIAKLLIGMAY